MNKKILRIISLIACLIVIISSVIYLFTDNMIPGLSASALSILMYAMFMNKKNQKWARGLALLACALNFAVAIMQIYVSATK